MSEQSTIAASRDDGPDIDVDMDGVTANLVKTITDVFNRRHGKTIGEIRADWREYRIEKQFPKTISDMIYAIMQEPGFFASIEPYPDAEQALRELFAFARKLETCSSPPVQTVNGKKTLNAYAAADKIGWLFRQFNDMDLTADVTLTLKKRRIRSDVLIDDDPIGNVIPWCIDHPHGLGYLVARPWNEDLSSRVDFIPPNLVRGTFADAPRVIRAWWAARAPRVVSTT